MSEEALRRIAENKTTKDKILDLSYCGIQGYLPMELAELTWLEELDLNGNDLRSRPPTPTDRRDTSGGQTHPLAPIAALVHLYTLKLSYTQVANIQPLAALVHLSTLNLSFTQVANIQPLAELANLNHLHLRDTQVADIQPLAKLANLNSLNLDWTNVADIQPLEKLANLNSLYLSNTQVADIRPLAKLANLNSLYLYNTQVADIHPLANLANLKSLDLHNTQVASIQPLAKLANLKSLNIGGTKVTNVQPLAKLANLYELYLWGTQVADLQPLEVLANLNFLDLTVTQVADIQPLSKLSNLKSLYLSGSQVTDIEPLAKLANLDEVYLWRTQVADIQPLAELANLNKLQLSNTKVVDIKPLERLIQKGLPVKLGGHDFSDGIFLQNCPLTNPPLEIAKKGNAAILRYWEQTDTVPLYEAKVLLVGEPKAGKTTLWNQMFAPEKGMPPEADRTEGIDIHHWKYTLPDGHEMRLNIWDFGGQEILHATHQFFLTKRSVYILLDNTASNHKTVQDAYFREWLGWIELLGGDSPVLIFQNEMKGHRKDIGMDGIVERFPNVRRKLYKGNLSATAAAREIKQDLEELAAKLPHIGEKWPRKWLEIRKEMETLALEKPFISYEAYLELCKKQGETDERKALDASQAFHHLGVCLHFWEDRLLRRLVVLRNEWATEPVYQILRDATITLQKGRFRQSDLDRIWSAPQYVHHHLELLALMERFELCYPLPGCDPETWLVPQLLPVEPPKPLPFVAAAGDLILRYKYRFMPKGLLSRLMTRMHRYVTDAGKAWVTGVIFEKNGAHLLASLNDTGDELILRANGKGTSAFDLLTIIADDLDDLSAQFEHRPGKLVPCNCKTCSALETPHFYDQSDLKRRMELGKRTVECKQPPYHGVEVIDLLTGIGLAPIGRDVHERETIAPGPKLKMLRIYLATSSDMVQERREFELFIGRENRRLVSKQVFLDLEMAETLTSHVTLEGSQTLLNQAAAECDIFVSLTYSKVEPSAASAFDAAFERFKAVGQPRLFTYFQHSNINTGSLNQEIMTMLDFQKRLRDLGHFPSAFTNTQDLQFQFRGQLERILGE